MKRLLLELACGLAGGLCIAVRNYRFLALMGVILGVSILISGQATASVLAAALSALEIVSDTEIVEDRKNAVIAFRRIAHKAMNIK